MPALITTTMENRQKVSEQIEAINLFELETKARELLPQTAYDYYASGANDEITLRENRAAYERITILELFSEFELGLRFIHEVRLVAG